MAAYKKKAERLRGLKTVLSGATLSPKAAYAEAFLPVYSKPGLQKFL